MKRPTQLIRWLDKYLVARETASQAKAAQEDARDHILAFLPKSEENEWDIAGWGKVTYHQPEDSLVVDLERLKAEFPKAYASCVRTRPNSPRFCVTPDLITMMRRSHVSMENARKVR